MKKFIIYTDGGSRSNPGPAAIGAVILNESGAVIKEISEYIGQATNNEAEYQAVIAAFKKLKAMIGKAQAKQALVKVFADSELLVKQLNGAYKIEHPNVQPLFLELWNLKVDFGKVQFQAVPREQNKRADWLVNEALDGDVSKRRLF